MEFPEFYLGSLKNVRPFLRGLHSDPEEKSHNNEGSTLRKE